VNAINLILDSSDGLVVMNAVDVDYESLRLRMATNAHLVGMLYLLTEMQVYYDRRYLIIEAARYQDRARMVGNEIMHRVKEGLWDT